MAIYPGAPSRLVEHVQKAVTAAFEFQAGEIVGPRRQKRLALARHVAMLLTVELLPALTLSEVSRLFNRDRATLNHGIAHARASIAFDETLCGCFLALKARLALEIKALRDQSGVWPVQPEVPVSFPRPVKAPRPRTPKPPKPPQPPKPRRVVVPAPMPLHVDPWPPTARFDR